MAKVSARTVGDCFVAECPARDVLHHISNRWGGLVLGSLLERDLRYSEIRARVGGISEKMLAQTLDVLERDGLIVRTSRPVVPPHVEYALTTGGRAIAVRLFELFRYIGDHIESFVTAQNTYDALSTG
jgi:DNA-binding HxlR family transcriptional regulator